MRIQLQVYSLFAPIVAGLLAGCGGAGSGVGSASPAAIVPLKAATISVVMNQPWTDSGMAVVAGTKFSVTATGTLNRETGKCNGTCVTTPAGVAWSVCATQPAPAFTAPGLPCWSLIGRIGSGSQFEIGASSDITANVAGEFYLGINDNFFPDDTGDWVAAIKPL